MAKATPESFRYSLQEAQLLTYRVDDERQGRGFCTLLPWGYIFTSDHQPAEHVYQIYQGSAAVTFNSTLTDVHRRGIHFYLTLSQYIIHTIPVHIIAPWAHDQGHRVLVPPISDVEDEIADFVLDGE